ncbi:MAG: FtsX-like permease family protein [Vicinamibacterales bacterium]
MTGARVLADLRDARRSLRARPGAAIAVVLVLTLGVGLFSAMFALADPFVLRPLPYADPDALVVIRAGTEGLTPDAPIPTVGDWRARTDLFEGLAVIGDRSLARVHVGDAARLLSVGQASENVFDVLGISSPVTVAWRSAAREMPETATVLTPTGLRRLGIPVAPGDRLRRQGGAALDVIGVLPESFPAAPAIFGAEAYVPFEPTDVITVRSWARDRPAATAPTLVARLRPGVSAAAVRAALASVLPSGRPLDVRVESVRDVLTRRTRPLALGALAAGFVVLLVCAGNVGNLLLARTEFRSAELATRAALGASRWDLVRLGLAEQVVIAAIATAAGLVVARVALAGLAAWAPSDYLTLGVPGVTRRVVALAAVACAVCVLLGAVPLIWRRSGTDLLRGRAEASGASGRGRRLRLAFVGAQAGLAMILAVGAAVLIQSYVNLLRQDIGLDEETVALTAMYPVTGAAVPRADLEATVTRLRQVPGVTDAAYLRGTLVDGIYSTMGVWSISVRGEEHRVEWREVSPRLFDVTGMTLLAGRAFGPEDGGGRSVILSESLANLYWPGDWPIGEPVNARGGGVVIGVVRDAFKAGRASPPEPTMYTATGDRVTGDVSFAIRPDTGASPSRDALTRAVANGNPDVVILWIDTAGHLLTEKIRDRVFATFVLTLFGVAGGTVATIGLVAIVGFVVARRTREIAIRLALGAPSSHVRALVARETVAAAVAGGLAGLVAGRWLSTWLDSLAYGVTAGNWTTTLAAGMVMVGVMTVAALVPARRAVRLSPVEALRRD